MIFLTQKEQKNCMKIFKELLFIDLFDKKLKNLTHF